MSSNHDNEGSDSLRKEIALALKTQSPFKHALLDATIENIDHPTPITANLKATYETIKQDEEASARVTKRRMLDIGDSVKILCVWYSHRRSRRQPEAKREAPERNEPRITRRARHRSRDVTRATGFDRGT